MLKDVDPRLVRCAREARSQHRHLYVMKLPLASPYRERIGFEKKAGKKHPVFRIQHEAEILFRALTANEFDQFSQEAQFTDITEDVVRTAVLWPKKTWKKHPLQYVAPGHFDALRDQIIEISGFGSDEALEQGIQHGRDQANNIYGAIQAFICKAFPAYTPISISTLPWLDQVKLLGMAEVLLATEFPLTEILKGMNEEDVSRPPRDFSKLPVFSEGELEEMRTDSQRQAMVKQMHDRRREATGAEVDEQARRRVDEVARKRMEQERQSGAG